MPVKRSLLKNTILLVRVKRIAKEHESVYMCEGVAKAEKVRKECDCRTGAAKWCKSVSMVYKTATAAMTTPAIVVRYRPRLLYTLIGTLIRMAASTLVTALTEMLRVVIRLTLDAVAEAA